MRARKNDMRFPSFIVIAAGTFLTVFACSSSSETTPAPATPDGGATSSSGTTDNDAGSTSSSGGDTGAPDTGPPAWVKTTEEMFDHEGVMRTYYLSVPLNYDATKKYPVYIWLHGNPGTAQWASGFALHIVTHDEAIIVYPGSLVDNGWDHTAALQDNADSTLLMAVIDQVDAKVSIDKKRMLLSGWSGGGFMSSLMACRFYASFRAIGIHAGGAPFDPNGGPNPECDGASIATLVTHGNADGTVPFEGGEYAGQYWSEHNGCDGTLSASTPTPCQTYDGCPADKPVKVCFIPGLGHPLWDQAILTEWAWFKALP